MTTVDWITAAVLATVLIALGALAVMFVGSVRAGYIHHGLARQLSDKQLTERLDHEGPTYEVIQECVSRGVLAGTFESWKRATRIEIVGRLAADLTLPLMLLFLPVLYAYTPESAKAEPLPASTIVTVIAGFAVIVWMLLKETVSAIRDVLTLRQLAHPDGLAFADKVAESPGFEKIPALPLSEPVSLSLLRKGGRLDRLERAISFPAMLAGLFVMIGILVYVAGTM